MNRRDVFKTLSVGGLSLAAPGIQMDAVNGANWNSDRGSFSLDGPNLRFTHPEIREAFSVTMIADTHLFRDDERGEPYAHYSGRMAKAYNSTRHFLTGETINPEIGFEKALEVAKEKGSSFIALVGDIFSFPSEASIEWVEEKLKACGLPYVYTAGNHDWHYEGMEGTSEALRQTWINKRLLRFYDGRDPMMQKLELNGVNLVVIDNSTYEVNADQLRFLRDSLAEQKPTVLMLHIPLYATGRSMGFGCAHPDWNAANDENYELERRLPWREAGHTPVTMDFYKTVLESKNLMGVLAGHIHNQSVDVLNGIPQVVAESNAEGGYLQLSFVPIG